MNRKILAVMDPWKDRVPHVPESVNDSVCESTGRYPYSVMYGMEKRLSYDLLDNPQKPVYYTEDYIKIQLNVFFDIHKDVRHRLLASKTEMTTQQHRHSFLVKMQVGESIMIGVPRRN